jgi:hypothetical protein
MHFIILGSAPDLLFYMHGTCSRLDILNINNYKILYIYLAGDQFWTMMLAEVCTSAGCLTQITTLLCRARAPMGYLTQTTTSLGEACSPRCFTRFLTFYSETTPLSSGTRPRHCLDLLGFTPTMPWGSNSRMEDQNYKHSTTR